MPSFTISQPVSCAHSLVHRWDGRTPVSYTHLDVYKRQVPYIDLKLRHGIVGDAHAGDWHRQISLLAEESVDTMRAVCPIALDSGIFAENINTRGIEPVSYTHLDVYKRQT